MKRNVGIIVALLLVVMVGITGCSLGSSSSSSSSSKSKSSTSVQGTLTKTEVFTERDLDQTIDTSEATTYTVSDGKDITITFKGTYVITGSAKNVTITVAVDDEDKVELILDNLTIENDSKPCIYVKTADKVFITTTNDNSLTVSGEFEADGSTNTDAVIFSKEDIVLKGNGTLTITSTDNGITSKDDLKITGGTITINCKSDALEANDSIAIADSDITIQTNKDGLHAEYDEDDSVGYVYIAGGTLVITAGDDAIHATTILQVDGGEITTTSKEGLEGTYIQINGGTINITASDDGINAASQSKSYDTKVEINGGEINITMGQGDTDGIDSNGDIIINDGTVNITGQNAFDYDNNATYNGGTIIVNGETTNEITNQFANGGPGGGGQRGNQGGQRGPGGRR